MRARCTPPGITTPVMNSIQPLTVGPKRAHPTLREHARTCRSPPVRPPLRPLWGEGPLRALRPPGLLCPTRAIGALEHLRLPAFGTTLLGQHLPTAQGMASDATPSLLVSSASHARCLGAIGAGSQRHGMSVCGVPAPRRACQWVQRQRAPPPRGFRVRAPCPRVPQLVPHRWGPLRAPAARETRAPGGPTRA